LEDDIGAELPTALVTACLKEEVYKGTSAAALDALGILMLFHSGMSETVWCEDVATQEIIHMTQTGLSPYAPLLRALCDEDPIIPSTELSARSLENVVQPRQTMDDFGGRHSLRDQCGLGHESPVITTALIHQLQTTPSMFQRMRPRLPNNGPKRMPWDGSILSFNR